MKDKKWKMKNKGRGFFILDFFVDIFIEKMTMGDIRKVRRLIREILEEVFDKPTMPKDIEILTGGNYVVYKFKTEKNEYAVSFTKKGKILDIMMPKDDEKAKDIIKNSESIYFLSWGLFDESRPSEPFDEIDTKAGEEIYVFDSVFAIVLEFVKQYDPEIIIYWALKKRKRIYSQVIDKIGLNYKLISSYPNIYLIKKEIYEQ